MSRATVLAVREQPDLDEARLPREHPHLHELVTDEEVIKAIVMAAQDAEATARNEGADSYALRREVGERAYHLMGRMLSSKLITDLGFQQVDVNGGQYRWISPGERYSTRLTLVHCRGRKCDGHITVNAKGPNTRLLVESNARQIDPQYPLFGGDSQPTALLQYADLGPTVWILTETDKHGLAVYLAVPLNLSPSGTVMFRIADAYRLTYISFEGEALFGEVSPPPSPEEDDQFAVHIESR